MQMIYIIYELNKLQTTKNPIWGALVAAFGFEV